MKVDLTINTKNKGKSKFKNLMITTDSGLTFQIKYAFYNSKLAYRLEKEIEESLKVAK